MANVSFSPAGKACSTEQTEQAGQADQAARTRSRTVATAAAAVAVVTLGVGAMTACSSSDKSPLGDTQWQVSHIYDEVSAGGLLPPPSQARTYLVFGEDHFTGESGCVRLFGKLSWTGDYQNLKIDEFNTDSSDDGDPHKQCQPGDEETAARLRNVLAHQDLKVTRPQDNALKLMQIHKDDQQWQNDYGVAFISGPANTDSGDSGKDK